MLKINSIKNVFSNALANVTRRLIGRRQKFATVYSAIFRRKPDMSNVACSWSTLGFCVADGANIWDKIACFFDCKSKSTLECGSPYSFVSFGEVFRRSYTFENYVLRFRRYTSRNVKNEYSKYVCPEICFDT